MVEEPREDAEERLAVDVDEADLRLPRRRAGEIETARTTWDPSVRFHKAPLLIDCSILSGGCEVEAPPRHCRYLL